MGNVIKKSFQILMKNSAIMQPIIFFVIFLIVFNSYVGVKALANSAFAFWFVLLALLSMTAFLSGWFYVIKYAVDNYCEFDKNDSEYSTKIAKYNIESLKKFFVGVGEYFLPILGLILLNIVIFTLFIYLGQKVFGVTYLQVLTMQITPQTVEEVLKNTSLIKFLLYIDCLTLIFHFLTIFWVPFLYYKTKNPIMSFVLSLKFLFKNLVFSLGLYAFIITTFFAINFISLITSFIPLLSLIVFIVLLYFSAYIFILFFQSYKQKLVDNNVAEMNANDVFVKTCENKDFEDVE